MVGLVSSHTGRMPRRRRGSKWWRVVSNAHIGRAHAQRSGSASTLVAWSAFYRLQSLEIIAKQNANCERHFGGDCRSIAVAAFAKLASCVMSDLELHAPKSNGPSAHAEHIGDVFLKNSVGFQLSEKLLVRTPVYATRNIVFLAPSVNCVSGDAADRCNCWNRCVR